MLTDQDIEKMRAVFFTKEDGMNLKKELLNEIDIRIKKSESMLLSKLSEGLHGLSERVDRLSERVQKLSQRVHQLFLEIQSLREDFLTTASLHRKRLNEHEVRFERVDEACGISTKG